MIIGNQKLITKKKNICNKNKSLKDRIWSFFFPEHEIIYKVEVAPYEKCKLQIDFHLIDCSVRSSNNNPIIATCTFDSCCLWFSSNSKFLKCKARRLIEGTYELSVTSHLSVFKIETTLLGPDNTSTCIEFAVTI